MNKTCSLSSQNSWSPFSDFGFCDVLQAARKAEFTLGESMSTPAKDFALSQDVALSLGFRSTEKDGLLLQNKQAVSFFSGSA